MAANMSLTTGAEQIVVSKKKYAQLADPSPVSAPEGLTAARAGIDKTFGVVTFQRGVTGLWLCFLPCQIKHYPG